MSIPEVELPNAELISQRRQEKFAQQIAQQLETSNLDQYRIVAKLAPQGEEALDMETLAAVLLKMSIKVSVHDHSPPDQYVVLVEFNV